MFFKIRSTMTVVTKKKSRQTFSPPPREGYALFLTQPRSLFRKKVQAVVHTLQQSKKPPEWDACKKVSLSISSRKAGGFGQTPSRTSREVIMCNIL